jgi:hypothetical protein
VNSDLGILICCVLIIGFSPLAGLYSLYRDYKARVMGSKEISKLPGVVIPPEVSILITRFEPSVKVSVADNSDTIPQVATFYTYPIYIIISRFVLGQTEDAPQFDRKYLLALVAHELGHIASAGQSTWMLGICISGILGSLSFLLLTLVKCYWIGSLCSLLVLVFFWGALNRVSQIDEYRADAFAIKDALIPNTDLAEALKVLNDHVAKRDNASVSRSKFIKKALSSIMRHTHPTIDQRIRRMLAIHIG